MPEQWSFTEKPFFKRLDRDGYIDEIRLTEKPRFKTSGLSGDEWRTGVHIEFLRKGHVVWEKWVGSMRYAAAAIAWFHATADEGDDWKHLPDEVDDRLCKQPGCPKPAVHFVRLKMEACSNGHRTAPVFPDTRRGFCGEHKTRGDCGIEDADSNYEAV